MTRLRLFGCSVLLTTVVLAGNFYLHRPSDGDRPSPTEVAPNVFITSQLTQRGVRSLRRFQIGNIVDIRPDGEDQEETPSDQIQSAARAVQMAFHYIPVPHDHIPDEAVTALKDALGQHETPALLYCRSGRRAVRTFALAEASQTGGPNADAICTMARHAGFSADDLRGEIERRVAARNTQPTPQSDHAHGEP